MDWMSFLPPVITTLIGFVSGWGLSELTEWRRHRRDQRELRRALVAELENGEVLASVTLGKYARCFRSNAADVALVAKEIRWFVTVGRNRMDAAGILSDLPPTPTAFEVLTDQQLVDLFSQISETIGVKLIFPIVENALAGKTSGFNEKEIAALGMVSWHAHLLSQNADQMTELLRMSFTVTDDENHPRIIENHDRQSEWYARRSIVLLRVIRKALELLR